MGEKNNTEKSLRQALACLRLDQKRKLRYGPFCALLRIFGHHPDNMIALGLYIGQMVQSNSLCQIMLVSLKNIYTWKSCELGACAHKLAYVV